MQIKQKYGRKVWSLNYKPQTIGLKYKLSDLRSKF